MAGREAKKNPQRHVEGTAWPPREWGLRSGSRPAQDNKVMLVRMSPLWALQEPRNPSAQADGEPICSHHGITIVLSSSRRTDSAAP